MNTNAKLRYYAVDKLGNKGTLEEQIYTFDTVPPSAVTAQSAAIGDTTVALSWVNPSVDFSGVTIKRSTVNYPASSNDGDLVYEGNLAQFADTGLTNGTLYFYSIFAHDALFNYAPAVNIQVSPTGIIVNPSADAIDVPLSTPITAEFDILMSDMSIDSNTFQLLQDNIPVSGSVSYTNNTADIMPSSPLSLLTPYDVRLSSTIVDAYNNNLISDFNWRFVTKDGVWDTNKMKRITKLSSPGPNTYYDMVIDSKNNVFVAWTQPDTSANEAFYVIKIPENNSWNSSNSSSVKRISNLPAVDPGQVGLKIDPNDNVYFVWTSTDIANDSSVFIEAYLSTQNWETWGPNSSRKAIDNATGAITSRPKIEIDPNNNVFVLWGKFEGQSLHFTCKM